jgi:DNA-directed RNA polymerase specialized sigma24 family protein
VTDGPARVARERASDAGTDASAAGERTSDAGTDASVAGEPVSAAGRPASDASASASDANATASNASARATDADVPANKADSHATSTDASPSEADEPASAADAPAADASAPATDTDAPASDADAPASEADPPASDRPAPVSLADYRARVAKTSITHEAFRAFLADRKTQNWVEVIVAEKMPEVDVADVAQDTYEEAVKAFERAPPANSEVLLAWLETIARRAVADALEKKSRRAKYEGDIPDEPGDSDLESEAAPEPASVDDDDDEHPFGAGPHPIADPSVDPRAIDEDELYNAPRLVRWLEGHVADNPYDRETLELVVEWSRGKKTYKQIAAERGMTLVALSSRVFEFKKKYTPRYKRERTRAVLLLLLFGVAFAVVVYLLFRVPDAPHRPHAAPPRPLIDQIFGGPPPVSAPPPYPYEDDVQPDGGSIAPHE